MITETYADKILGYFFAQAESTLPEINQCYLGLSTTAPNADGSNFIEPGSSTGYKRALLNVRNATVSSYVNKMSAPASERIQNTEEIVFPEAVSDYNVTHFGIFSSEKGDDLIYFHAITNEEGEPVESGISVVAGEVVLFRQHALSISFAQDVATATVDAASN